MTRARGALALGVVLCLVAGAFAATPLFIPGLALLLVVLVAVAWVSLVARGARVVRSVDRESLPEGAPLRLSVRVVRSRVPTPGVELRAWGGGPALRPPRRSGEDATMTDALRLERRGRQRLDPASLEISDPLGLCRRMVFSAAHEILVLPRVEPVELDWLDGAAARWHGGGAGAGAAGATDVDSLQPHQPGTPASRIHWPAVARTGTLIERRLVADADQLAVIAVDPRGPASAEALDRAVRAAASLCVHLGRRGGCALLLPGDRRATLIDRELYGFAEAHVRLALLNPDAGAPPVSALTGAGSVLWVSAATVPSDLPGAVHFLVSPHFQPRWPARFEVAGCRAYELAPSGSRRLAV